MRYTVLALGLGLAAAAAATYARYASLDPCAWLSHDMARATDLPPLVVEARLRAAFLLDGIAEPDSLDCLVSWWRLKAEGAPKN